MTHLNILLVSALALAGGTTAAAELGPLSESRVAMQDVSKAGVPGKSFLAGTVIGAPLAKLCAAIQAWRMRQDHEFSWVFANPKSGGPYSDSTVLTNYLKPAAKALGIAGLGWHTLRHSYKSWMATANISPAQMKDLMRHSDIETTMNVYGKTLTPELRAANLAVADGLL